MSRLLEFVGNHPLLWTLFGALLVALVVVELRARARGTLNLSIFDFTRELNSGNALLIDLRPSADFDKGHIRGARHLTPSQVDPGAKEIARHKDGTVLLYCQSGITSGEVADRLLEYAALDIDHFILSGYPHLEEAHRVAELVFPLLPLHLRAQLAQPAPSGPFGEIVANTIVPPAVRH